VNRHTVKNKNRTKTIIKLKIIHKRAIVEEREKIKTKKTGYGFFIRETQILGRFNMHLHHLQSTNPHPL